MLYLEHGSRIRWASVGYGGRCHCTWWGLLLATPGTAFDYNGSARSLTFTGIHPGGDPGSVTCRVFVGGRTIVSHTNNAPKAAGMGAYCNIVNLGSGYVGN
jgi:hypothetical protein